MALPARGVEVVDSREGRVVPSSPTGRLRIAVSRSRSPSVAERVAQELGADLVSMGSAGAKVFAVLRGEVDAYLHAGGQFEWDSAAPVAVTTAAGLHCSRLDGSPPRYGRLDPWLPDLLVCHPRDAGPILTAVG